MKRLFVKKTKNMTNDTEIKKWAETLKKAEPHFTACANYCKNVKRLLKDLDSNINKKNTVKNYEIAGNIGEEWNKVQTAYKYIEENENLKEIFKTKYTNKEDLVTYVNSFFNSSESESK